MVLLSVAVLEFDFATRSELRSAAYFRDDQKAYYLARAGISAAQAVLAEDARQDGRSPSPFDALTEIWAVPVSPFSLGDGTVWGQITDEAGKININQIVKSSMAPQIREGVRKLFESLNIPAELVDRMAEFLKTRDAPFDHLSELHLVEGLTDEIFRKISPFVTVYGAAEKINVNTAPIEVLQALGLETMADRLVRARPIKSTDELRQVTGTRTLTELPFPADLKSLGYFSVQGEGKVGDVIRRLQVVLKRKPPRVEILFFKIE